MVAGIADECSHKGVARFTELLTSWSGSQGYCVYALVSLNIAGMLRDIIAPCTELPGSY